LVEFAAVAERSLAIRGLRFLVSTGFEIRAEKMNGLLIFVWIAPGDVALS